MSVENNKATVRRYYEEVKNQGNLDLLKELAAPDYTEHNPIPGQEQGLKGLRQRAEMMARAFRIQINIEDMIAASDEVAVRLTNHLVHNGTFMGIAATGRSATIQGIAIHRLKDGKIAERWIVMDNLFLLQQLGAFPQPAAPKQ